MGEGGLGGSADPITAADLLHISIHSQSSRHDKAFRRAPAVGEMKNDGAASLPAANRKARTHWMRVLAFLSWRVTWVQGSGFRVQGSRGGFAAC